MSKHKQTVDKLTAMGRDEKLMGSPDRRDEAVQRVQKILDESGLDNDSKIRALHMAGEQLGVPFPLTPEELKRTSGLSPDHAAETVVRGEFTFPRDKIPSVTSGKSPAMDFASALMQGNPEAVRIAREATGGEYDLVQGPDGSLSMPQRKKEQSLADVFMSSTYEWCKYFNYNAKAEKAVMPILNHYRQSLRQSHRFELDNDFVAYATEVSNGTKPEKLLYRLQFATLPYETTWVEFDLHTKVRAMRAWHGLHGVPDGVATRMGILIKRIDEQACTVEMIGESIANEITAPCLHGYIFSINERSIDWNRKFNGLTPFSMRKRASLLAKSKEWADLNTPEAQQIIGDVSRGALWGYGDQSGVIEAGDLNHLRVPPYLEQHGEIGFSPFYDFFEYGGKLNPEVMKRISKTVSSEIAEFTGMMRWLVTVLAMMNEVPTRTDYVMPSHQVRAGLTKRLPAFDYHRVTLRLPKSKAKPVPYLERYLSNVERKHRAHEVRAHWRTYLSEHPCPRDQHEWVDDIENGYRLCKCMSFSRLIHEHVRGDPNLGWVHQEYVIKRAKQGE